MGFIDIDPKLQKSEDVADFISSLISDQRGSLPSLPLPIIELAKLRPGLDSEEISDAIISRFNEAGIPTGPLSEGVPNALEGLVRIMMEELVDAIQDQMRVEIAVDPGMQVVSNGANSGGPVLSTGSNIMPHTAIGIPR